MDAASCLQFYGFPDSFDGDSSLARQARAEVRAGVSAV
ncbi:hypothetical protein SLI_7958 [Streptomyces lividans 1326]|uniref:Uncharacterized protein n=1 Tax=Streptomyces lividans 1326 TaxID=1200984 RepID=A0A7U9E3H9_STRLI|nr:hypothetical protein SLI_7958 [Streptomyces lividans 1326]